MKRIAVLLLVAVLCLSLCACGNSKELEKYRKYETLIDHLENGDYTSAYLEIANLSASKNNSQESEKTTTVEITMDNWQEYFEIVLGTDITRDAFDEVKYVYSELTISLKEEFRDRLQAADVAFGWHASEYGEYTFVHDLNTGSTSYEVLEARDEELEDSTRYYYDLEGTIWGAYDYEADFFSSHTLNKPTAIEGDTITWQDYEYTKMEITRVQGTLTLKVE